MEQTSPFFKKCDVTYTPVFLGGIIKACGNTPPIGIKSTSTILWIRNLTLTSVDVDKGPWADRMRIHWARLFNVPMDEKMPEGFPHNTILVSTGVFL